MNRTIKCSMRGWMDFPGLIAVRPVSSTSRSAPSTEGMPTMDLGMYWTRLIEE